MRRQKEAWKGRAQELQESELEKEKEYWKSRAQELQDDNIFLKAQVASLQRCLESKMFQIEQGKARYSQGMTAETLKHWGVQKSVSTEEAEKTLTRTLTEKIQDLLKSKLRKQIKFLKT
ncbi:uncharacterized protein LOC144113409 [Amblyomma americanum]